MNRRMLILLLGVVLCLSLVSCTSRRSSNKSIEESAPDNQTLGTPITYDSEEFLPIGSVVLLKGGNKRIMICGRIQAQAGTDIIYDYSACYYPEGIIDTSSMFFFNRDAIETVYYRGYEDQEELDYRSNVLDQLGELEIRDGVIVSKDK